MTRGCGRKDRIDGRSERDRKNENLATQDMCNISNFGEQCPQEDKTIRNGKHFKYKGAKVLSNGSSLEVPTGSKSIVRILVKPTEFLCPTYSQKIQLTSVAFLS